MSSLPDSASEKVPAACPQCGKRFAVDAAHVGRQARCPACEQVFVIRPAVAGAAASAHPAAPSAASVGGAQQLRCGVCQSLWGDGEQGMVCPACAAPFHRECWEYNGGCGVYGCPQAPPTEGLSSLEVPPSYWGCEEKPCPRCRQTIHAAAVRCRHCGATFSSAAPQGPAAYEMQRRLDAELPTLRTAGIWLLVLSFIPCTAPLAGGVGLTWFLARRSPIRRLPPVQIAIWKIAIALGFAQTFLLVLFGVLAGALGGSGGP
jgi:hypothetical protein